MIYGSEYENSGSGNEEELALAKWDTNHNFPLIGDMALIYADEQAACLIASYGHGTTEAEKLALLRAHIARCVHCNPAAVCCETGNLYTPLVA